MTKIKTRELTGAALDWAVSKCEGPVTNGYGDVREHQPNYSTDWSQGGPIIEREWCFPAKGGQEGFNAISYKTDADFRMEGPTPLIAAMRCYCASKLGDEIDVPEELT